MVVKRFDLISTIITFLILGTSPQQNDICKRFFDLPRRIDTERSFRDYWSSHCKVHHNIFGYPPFLQSHLYLGRTSGCVFLPCMHGAAYLQLPKLPDDIDGWKIQPALAWRHWKNACKQEKCMPTCSTLVKMTLPFLRNWAGHAVKS